ncbi:hypothetical protein MY3296_008081 [Beauveria thailandica]
MHGRQGLLTIALFQVRANRYLRRSSRIYPNLFITTLTIIYLVGLLVPIPKTAKLFDPIGWTVFGLTQ